MKRFSSFVIKEFFHIVRDKRTLLILFGMPIAQILLFGYAITTEIREAKIAIFDPSKDVESRLITDRILASSYFDLSENLHNSDQIEEVFKSGNTKVVLVFEDNFSEKLQKENQASVQIIADATDPNMANSLVNYLQAIISNHTQQLNTLNDIPLQVSLESRMWYNPGLEGAYYFVPGLIAVLLMLVSAMMTSISIAREKELGTMEVLLASPMKPAQIILAKVVPYIVLSLLDAMIILAMGKFVFGVPIEGSLFFLILETLLFILLALSLGILISTIAETQQTALMLSLMALMLPTILLSGFIFPIENMPLVLQWISNIIPARWFIIIVKSIMLKGLGFELLWKETLIICGFIFFFVALSVKKFKVRLE